MIPRKRQLTETKVPYQTTTDMPTHTWRDILCRLRGIGEDVSSGAARVTIMVLVCDGKPTQWFAPTVERLEPRRAARQFVEQAKGMDE
jgi:hypothetical protein